MHPRANGSTASADPGSLPTASQLRHAAFEASDATLLLFDPVLDRKSAVVDFHWIMPAPDEPPLEQPPDRHPMDGARPRPAPADLVDVAGNNDLLPQVRENVLSPWARALATGVPDERLVGVPGAAGQPARSLSVMAFATGGRLAVCCRSPYPADAPAGRPDAFLAQSLLAAGVSSWEWDPDRDVLRWISEPPGLLGLTPGDGALRLRDFLGFVHPADRDALERAMRASLETRTAFRTQFRVGDPGRFENGTAADRADGRTNVLAGGSPSGAEPEGDDGSMILRIAGNATADGDRRRVAGVVEDVTQATRARRAMTQNQRLASLGQLAAGIAHDFNNVLTVVTMRADMLRAAAQQSPGGAASEEDAVAILEAASRAAALTRQLMLFAGHQGGRTAEIDVGGVVSAVRPLVDAMREDVFTTAFEVGRCPPVRTERVQIEQIVVNLALNARDALREVPRPTDRALVLTIRVRALSADAPELGDHTPVPPHPAADGSGKTAGDVSWIALEVADTGVGMDPATQARALDPFFTTKPVGVGTGLGLSVVHGLVEQLGGALTVESELGAGTTVRVVLPGTRLIDTPTVDALPRRPVGIRSRLVVVDDDDAVRSVTSRSLAMHGFEVLQAHNAEEALAVLASETEIAALVSDIVMPGMSGTDLAARVLEDYPAVPILLVTGYTPPTDVISNPRLSLVTKPLTGARLAQSLNELLSRVEAAAGVANGGARTGT
jgi:signal transduction histidine kinase/CheY-like chemotaxis protein